MLQLAIVGLDETMDEGTARRFGRYRLLYRFASGGMADLYLARLTGEEGFERLVAIKVIHEHLTREPEFVKMFIDEARLASRISHPNVALTLDLGRVGNKHFIAMEYMEGESLAGLLRRTRPPLTYAVRIVSDAAAGLHAAHELRDASGQLLGVVHRDVSPQNILVSYDGAVKVVDFGVARARGSLHSTGREFKGKLSYMSPEQFDAPSTVDRRTDVFALGVVLYEATTRKRLFKGETESETVSRVLKGKVTPPSKLVPDYPPTLERIVLRALKRDPDRRYPSAQELHDELERFIVSRGEPVSGMAIGAMMREVFPDRIEEKKTLREFPGRADEETIPAVELASGSSVDINSIVPSYRPRRRSRAFVTLVVLLVAVAGLAGLGLVLLRGPAPKKPTAAAPAARPDATPVAGPDLAPRPRVITIAGHATPEGATLRLDGKPMGNPFEVQRPAAEGVAVLVVSAPGHQSQRFEVPLSRGGTFSVSLAPEPRPRKPRRPHRKRGTKHGPGYLDNPYQER